jgi:rhodanese-related sulfurtransferase
MRTAYTDIAPSATFCVEPGARVIDVREPHERDDGYIDGSENVPLGNLVYAARSWNKHAPLVLVCRGGARSALAAKQLAGQGFDNVYNMTGGMQAYVAAGLPVRVR